MSVVVINRGRFDEGDVTADIEVRDAVKSFEEQALILLQRILVCVGEIADLDTTNISIP